MTIRHLSGMFLILLLFAVPAEAQEYDDFSSATLQPEWTVLREVPDHWRLHEGVLEITTQLGALNGKEFNNVQNMFLQSVPVTDALAIETQLYFTPEYVYHNAGLVYYVDDDNYIRVSRGIVPNVNGVWMEWEVDGETNFHYVGDREWDSMFLKLERREDSLFTAYYASDKTAWQIIATESIQFPDNTPMAGLQAANGEGLIAQGDEIPALFEYFGSKPLAAHAPAALPAALELRSVYPAPAGAGGSVTVAFRTAQEGEITWKLTDLMGREILPSRSEGRVSAGSHTIQCQIGDVPPGMYFMHVMAARSRVVQRILLTR